MESDYKGKPGGQNNDHRYSLLDARWKRKRWRKLFFQSDSTSKLEFPIRPSSTLQRIDKIQLLTGVFRYLTNPKARHAKKVWMVMLCLRGSSSGFYEQCS